MTNRHIIPMMTRAVINKYYKNKKNLQKLFAFASSFYSGFGDTIIG